MRPYSEDLRKRVLTAYLRGEGSQRELAERFQVSRGFIQNLLARYRETGGLAPKPHTGGVAPRIGPEERAILRRLVREEPDATLEQFCKKFAAETNITVSISTMHRALKQLEATDRTKAGRQG